MNRISRVNTFMPSALAEYYVNAEVEGREFLLMIQESRKYRFYLGHPSIGPLSESRAETVRAALADDGYAAEIDTDVCGHRFVRVPRGNEVFAGIPGYEYVEGVKVAYGCEHTGESLLFVVSRDCGGNYLSGIREVCENTRDNHGYLAAKYPFADYIIWWGCVTEQPGGGKAIEFYWS